MEHHQKNSSGNGLIIAQMTDSFRMPKDFSSLVYLSMVLQAEGIRYGVEHWRRNKHRVSGTLYWQLNDCWPVASWSSLDYYGRWKALHYHAKNFYAPLLLSLKDEEQTIGIFVTSDLTDTVKTYIRWHLIDLDGKILDSGETTCELASLESRRIVVKKYQLSDEEKRKTVFVSELFYQDTSIMQKMVTFVPNKHLELKRPLIEWNIMDDNGTIIIHLRSNTLARFVELSLENKDVIFNDNYFDLFPGMEKTISILSEPEHTIQEVAQNLVVRSLYDSYA